jgi:acetyl esterase/lipase
MRLSPFRSPARVVVWQGLADKDVLPAHTAELVEVLRERGQPVELRWVPGADHLGVAFGFLGAIDAAGAEADALILEELHRD